MSDQTPELQDLLEKYADTCITIGAGVTAAKVCTLAGYDEQTIKSVFRLTEVQKADLESQIIKLFEEAKSEGARVERAECIKIASDYELLSAKAWDEKYGRESVVEVIQARGNQADEGKVGE